MQPRQHRDEGALTPIVLFSCHYFYVNPLNEGQNAMSELFRGVTAKGEAKTRGKANCACGKVIQTIQASW